MPKSLSMYSLQGTPAIVSSGNGRVDVFAVSRGGELWWFYSTDGETTWYSVTLNGSNIVTNPLGIPNQAPANALPIFSGGVTGDPVAVSRAPNQVEVFFRTDTGAFTHMSFDEAAKTWNSEGLFGVLSSQIIYDPLPGAWPTQCLAGGWWMHCCPTGYVMVGADVPGNVFKCAPLVSNPTGARTGDTGTWRNNMHSCPYGSVMAGLRADHDVLACVPVAGSGVVTERSDSGTQDARLSMHACDPGTPTGAMSGIDVGNNLFNCATTAQIQ